MITAGIDVGARTIQVIVLEDSRTRARAMTRAGFETAAALDRVFGEALERAGGLRREDLDFVVGTGAGREDMAVADGRATEVTAAARGACACFPATRTVVDVGAEASRAVRCAEGGRVEDFAVNEKCAAGAGTFIEAMARVLEVDLTELAQLSLRSKQAVPIHTQCTVFAESEVVSLLHARTPKEDIARAVHDAMAARITSIVRRVGLRDDVVLIGGLVNNVGFVDSLKRGLETEILVPGEPEYVGALGAAIIAADRAVEGRRA